MGDVFEYLIEGLSGLAPGGVDGKALVVGACSLGRVGKGYLVGKQSDLKAILGTGPLVDSVRDMFAAGGQDLVVVAVPAQGQVGGYISPVVQTGEGAMARVLGYPAHNGDILLHVTVSGALNVAKYKLSLDGGKTFEVETNASEQLAIGTGERATGTTLLFASDAELVEGTTYAFSVRTSISPVRRIGDSSSPLLGVEIAENSPTGGVLAGATLVVHIVMSGARNTGTYRLSVDGGDSYGNVRTIPLGGVLTVPDYGVNITFPEGTFIAGTTYTCQLLAPVPSIVDVMHALESPLSIYDVECVVVAGATDSVDWAAMQAKAEELWNAHRPTYFKAETRLPYAEEDLNDFTAYLLAERQGFTGRFVTVCCQYGEIVGANGESHVRNLSALQAGRTMSIPVQRATGRIKDGPITGVRLPEGFEAVQSTLEDAGFLTAKKYAGLSGVYWGDSRTMAEDTSDFRYEEVLRTTFKAVRKQRIAALKSLYDEVGDPLRPSDNGGLAYLKASIENALDSMTRAIPSELAGYVIEIPKGQDIVNNGVAVQTTLIGIPIIRTIKLFTSYSYAGSNFDPRII